MDWQQKLYDSGQDLCFSVDYQLVEDFEQYSNQWRGEYVKAKTENEVKNILKTRHGAALKAIGDITLIGTWSDFENTSKD